MNISSVTTERACGFRVPRRASEKGVVWWCYFVCDALALHPLIHAIFLE